MQFLKKLDDNNILAVLSPNDIKILEMTKSKSVQRNVSLAMTKLAEANEFLIQAITSSVDFWNKAYPSKQISVRLSRIEISAKKKRGKK